VFVAATTHSFAHLPLGQAMERLVDLEYSSVEIDISESGNHLRPSRVHTEFNDVVRICRETQRLTPIAYTVDVEATGDEYYAQFESCCKLAQATKVVSVVIRASELGTPFNAEVERLRDMVRIATLEGVQLGLKTEQGRISEDPDTVVVLCDNVPGLGVTLDASHFIYEAPPNRNYDKLMKYVSHCHVRDTSKTEFQVRVGQGEVEYSRLITQLNMAGYDRALSIDIVDLPESDVDHMGEMRKMRLLLESLL